MSMVIKEVVAAGMMMMGVLEPSKKKKKKTDLSDFLGLLIKSLVHKQDQVKLKR